MTLLALRDVLDYIRGGRRRGPDDPAPDRCDAIRWPNGERCDLPLGHDPALGHHHSYGPDAYIVWISRGPVV